MQIFGDYKVSVIRAFDEIDSNWRIYNGLVICGSHEPKNCEELINKIKEARENGTPFYGECWGYQLAAIEYARNLMGIKDATSEEWDKSGTFIVKKRKDGLNVGLKNGESYWNNYEVIIDMFIPDNFFIAQYHASYQSSIDKPHPLISSFIKYAKSKSSTKFRGIRKFFRKSMGTRNL